MNGQLSYPTIEAILEDNGVKSFKQTYAGLIAIHKRNGTDNRFYWKYYRWHSHYEPGFEDGYYYTGSTSKFERQEIENRYRGILTSKCPPILS